MNSYFVNSSFPVTLPGTGGGGQAGAAAESFLGQIPLYSSGYAADHPLRHYPGAAAVTAAVAYSASGAGAHQEKPYSASTYYQQAANGAYTGHRAAAAAAAAAGVGVGGATGTGACDYATAAAAAAAAAAATSFYRDKEHPCSLDDHQLLSQDGMQRKAECVGLGGKGIFGETMDDKQSASVPIYPWMQRMNACNGECLLLPLPPFLAYFMITVIKLTFVSSVSLSVKFPSLCSLLLPQKLLYDPRLLTCQSVMCSVFYCPS